MNKLETNRPSPPQESYIHKHGLHRLTFSSGEVVTAISAQTWSEYLSYLKQINKQDKLVVSPELITFAGQPLHQVGESKKKIESRINQITDLSTQYPNTTFLLGTPSFKTPKPRNTILVIENGQVLGKTHKRSGATQAERNNFNLPVEEPPFLIPGTNIAVLICSDLATSSLYSRPHLDKDIFNTTLERIGRESFIDKNPTFIHTHAKKLILPSCWGVGGNQELMKPRDANSYYHLQLRNLAWALFNNSQLEEIIIVDRTPIMSTKDQPYTPTKPYNGLIQKR